MAFYQPDHLLQCLYTRLSDDSALESMTQGIYTHTPQGAVLPYITLNIDAMEPYAATLLEACECEYTIAVYSNEAGYSEALEIIKRVVELLQDYTAETPEYALVNNRLTSSRMQRVAAHEHVEASASFRCVIQIIE